MNVLIIGSGAREHAIGWKLAQSKPISKLFFAPGNAGTFLIGTNLALPIPTLNASEEIWRGYFEQILAQCRSNRIELIVIQNESPLSHGMVDFLTKSGIKVFGPSREAAEIESSKIWAADFGDIFGLPVPGSLTFLYPQEFSADWNLPDNFRVVKKSGLAEGKGVVVASSTGEVHWVINKFLREGQAVIVQETLAGQEISAHAFTDGINVSLTPLSCDYKKIGEGNTGDNTGGVGSYSLAESFSERFVEISRITSSIVQNLEKLGRKFKGVIFPGLILTEDGIKILEVNCRFGDPETQVLLPRLKTDLLEIILAIVNDELHSIPIEWEETYAVCVVLCLKGYPDPKEIEIGFPISGLDSVPQDVLVFHAGTTTDKLGRVVTNSGRVLSVVALGKSLEEARTRVYEAIKKIHFEGMYFRSDIALNV